MTSAVDGVARDLIDDAALANLMDKIDSEGLELLGPDGVLTEPTSKITDGVLPELRAWQSRPHSTRYRTQLRGPRW